MEMTNTQTHAKRELEILVTSAKDPNNRPIIEEFIPEILALCEKFGRSGQSGGSAPYTASALGQAIKNLCLQKTIAPITGEDWEWGSVSPEQNNREGAIFKTSNGRAYYLDAIVWQGEDEHDTFTGSVEGIYSRQLIREYPFTPKTFRVNVKRELYDEAIHGPEDKLTVISCGDGDYVYFIKDREQLKEVFEYYDLYIPEK